MLWIWSRWVSEEQALWATAQLCFAQSSLPHDPLRFEDSTIFTPTSTIRFLPWWINTLSSHKPKWILPPLSYFCLVFFKSRAAGSTRAKWQWADGARRNSRHQELRGKQGLLWALRTLAIMLGPDFLMFNKTLIAVLASETWWENKIR